MIFDEFIEIAKQLTIGQEYPYLPSSKSSENKKFKLLEISEKSIKAEREGVEVSLSISHIKTLLKEMRKDIPIDTEKTLGSGGNTRSIEEALICLIPSVFYTRINNRKHIVLSSNTVHEVGKLTEWAEGEQLQTDSCLSVYLSALNFHKESNCEKTAKSYYISLLSKPFVILTGNSGTGKTQIAKKLSEFYSVKLQDNTESLENLFKYRLEKNLDIAGIKLHSVSKNAIEVFNTKNKKICISFGIIQEYLNWFIANGENKTTVRENMQKAGEYDGQSYSWDNTYLEKIAKFLYAYQQKNGSGNYVSNHLLVPVGADWTDNTKILGFYNPLKNSYQSTPILDFILLAERNRDIPFFLILDEMNLSHVERYFSDFLSAMESGEPIPLYKKEKNSDCDFPEFIILPDNLFVTGTVNIDETTYMFSPKVLDRANVIEFNPEQNDVLQNFKEESSSVKITPANEGSAKEFLFLAKQVRGSTQLPVGTEKTVKLLKSLSDILEDSGFEFAYRTTKEIRLYLTAAAKLAENDRRVLTENDYINLMDEQLLQKILPKIHGNRSQIGTLLNNLSNFCDNKPVELEDKSISGFNLPLSKRKIDRMIKQLETSQFASFI